MTHPPQNPLEVRIREIGRSPDLPRTPDLWPAIAARGLPSGRRPPIRRLWAPALAAVLLAIVAGAVAVPSARAALMEVIRVGVIRILVGAPPTPADSAPGAGTTTATPSPRATVLSPAPLTGLDGETDLESLRETMGDLVRLPSYPPDLGPPDRVYRQGSGNSLGLLIWLDPSDPARVRLALHILGPEAFAAKGEPQRIEETEVNGAPALWLSGPYLLMVREGEYELRTLVEGHVLVWSFDDATYRLETRLPLEDARRVAESLR